MGIMLSGGFDPLHIGHIRMITEAAQYGDVTIALNSDEWLMRKKGYYYMPWEERHEILIALTHVYRVVPFDDGNNTAVHAIRAEKPEFFGNGGDRDINSTPTVEQAECNKLDIKMIWGLGGGKLRSSSTIVMARGIRKWGYYEILYQGEFQVKVLTIQPGQGISIQSHQRRSEHWVIPSTNEHYFVPMGAKHSFFNFTEAPLEVVEVQTGSYFGEDDEEKFFTLIGEQNARQDSEG